MDGVGVGRGRRGRWSWEVGGGRWWWQEAVSVSVPVAVEVEVAGGQERRLQWRRLAAARRRVAALGHPGPRTVKPARQWRLVGCESLCMKQPKRKPIEVKKHSSCSEGMWITASRTGAQYLQGVAQGCKGVQFGGVCARVSAHGVFRTEVRVLKTCACGSVLQGDASPHTYLRARGCECVSA